MNGGIIKWKINFFNCPSVRYLRIWRKRKDQCLVFAFWQRD